MVLTDSPWAVWAWRLASSTTFWLAHDPGPLHPGREPVDAHRLAGAGHLPKPPAQLLRGGDEGPGGLAVPDGGQLAKQQLPAVAHPGLGDPARPPGAPVRQPVEDDHGAGIQTALPVQCRG